NDFRDAARATSADTKAACAAALLAFERTPGSQDHRRITEQTGACYSPGNMMWASDVPGNITQEPFPSRTSGSETSFPRRFGTAINECLTAVASLLPQNLYHMDPTSDMMRVPSFSAAATPPPNL